MKFRTGKLRRRDFKKALEFTIEGMQVEKYSDGKWFQRIYGRFFLYMEMDHATRMISVYENQELIGLLMADIEGERKRYRSLGRWLYMRFAMLIMFIFAGNGANSYGQANEEMLQAYRSRSNPDGEINFLAVDKALRGKGIGSKLIKALRKLEPGKEVYLYTDDNCVYQFYDRRGFTCEETRQIHMNIRGKEIPLTCMLYSIHLY